MSKPTIYILFTTLFICGIFIGIYFMWATALVIPDQSEQNCAIVGTSIWNQVEPLDEDDMYILCSQLASECEYRNGYPSFDWKNNYQCTKRIDI